MREHIDLVESMILKEFMFQVGDGPGAMFELNVFTDTIGEDPMVDEMPRGMARKYTKLAKAMADRIWALPNMPLLPTMIRELEDAWYDGSDAYDDGMYDALEEIYDEQLKTCDKVIGEIEQILANPESARTIVITNLLNMIKNGPGDETTRLRILDMIDSMRDMGMDYPEFDAIEKSLKSDLDEETVKQALKRGLMKGVKAGLVGTAIAVGMGSNYHEPKKNTNMSTQAKTDQYWPKAVKSKAPK